MHPPLPPPYLGFSPPPTAAAQALHPTLLDRQHRAVHHLLGVARRPSCKDSFRTPWRIFSGHSYKADEYVDLIECGIMGRMLRDELFQDMVVSVMIARVRAWITTGIWWVCWAGRKRDARAEISPQPPKGILRNMSSGSGGGPKTVRFEGAQGSNE
ncbi:hypothetical protein EJ02DRAFT_462970 [Clathrospora elynae]|uniref:Uncharacterized protein n=1 Tax=Clathrospora elynae TaxID=706981 RepID=A0A6A5SZB5_9PLEO|nr:hypothetical protein EJ02DRAFT_462970 [Clathrospora elynae]